MCFESLSSRVCLHTQINVVTIISTQNGQCDIIHNPIIYHKRDDDEVAPAVSSDVVAVLLLEDVISTMSTSLECTLELLFSTRVCISSNHTPAETTTKDVKHDNYCGGRKLQQRLSSAYALPWISFHLEHSL